MMINDGSDWIDGCRFYLEVSVAPKVISPLATLAESVVGTYEIPMVSVGIIPVLARLSTTVGTLEVPATVPVKVMRPLHW